MLISVVGTPTPFGYWGFDAALKAARFLFGELHHIHSHTLDGFKDGLGARGSRNVVFTSDQPPTAISELLLKLRTPIIIFEDDIRDIIPFLMELKALPFNEAAGIAAHSLAGLGVLRNSPHHLVLAKADMAADAAHVLERCLRFLDPDVTRERIASFCAETLTDYQPGSSSSVTDQIVLTGWPREYHPNAFRSRLSQSTALAHLDELIDKYLPILKGQVAKIDVDRRLLTFSEPYNPRTGVIDLAGAARCLVSGPAIYLPAGNWIAEITFEIADNISGNRLSIEVWNQAAMLAATRADLPRFGIFACEVRFVIKDDDLFGTLKLSTLAGSIEGHFVLQSLILRRLIEGNGVDERQITTVDSGTKLLGAASPEIQSGTI